jgi:hypothetical protein
MKEKESEANQAWQEGTSAPYPGSSGSIYLVYDCRYMVEWPGLVLRHYGGVCRYLGSGVLSYSLTYGGECGSLHLTDRADLPVKAGEGERKRVSNE